MPDNDGVDLTLLRGPDDDDPRASDLQAEISAFAAGLRREGVAFSQRGMAFDAVDVLGYPLPEFIVAVSPIAVAAIGGIVKLAQTWMETRPGRGIRLKDGDRHLEVDRVEDLPMVESFFRGADDDGVKRLAPRLWDEWTGNPWHLEAEEVRSSLEAVLAALRATHREGINDTNWKAAALAKLGPRPFFGKDRHR